MIVTTRKKETWSRPKDTPTLSVSYHCRDASCGKIIMVEGTNKVQMIKELRDKAYAQGWRERTAVFEDTTLVHVICPFCVFKQHGHYKTDCCMVCGRNLPKGQVGPFGTGCVKQVTDELISRIRGEVHNPPRWHAARTIGDSRERTKDRNILADEEVEKFRALLRRTKGNQSDMPVPIECVEEDSGHPS